MGKLTEQKPAKKDVWFSQNKENVHQQYIFKQKEFKKAD